MTNYIEINSNKLASNIKAVKQNFGHYKYFIGVIKGNAYGHGMEIISDLVSNGINFLAVGSIFEALEARTLNNDIPILCLIPLSLEEVQVAIDNNISITVHDLRYFENLSKRFPTSRLKIHLKLNTGFNRLGIDDKDHVNQIFYHCTKDSLFEIEGIYSHSVYSVSNKKFRKLQVKKFESLLYGIDTKKIKVIHFDRSGSLNNDSYSNLFNGVRIGSRMYGLGSSQIRTNLFKRILSKMFRLNSSVENTNVLSLYSKILTIRRLIKGDGVGYGHSYISKKSETIGILPIGYSSGFLKKNTGGHVFIKGRRYKILSIDMQFTTILVDENIFEGDLVEIFGTNISLSEVSRRTDMSSYEILTILNKDLIRIIK